MMSIAPYSHKPTEQASNQAVKDILGPALFLLLIFVRVCYHALRKVVIYKIFLRKGGAEMSVQSTKMVQYRYRQLKVFTRVPKCCSNHNGIYIEKVTQ